MVLLVVTALLSLSFVRVMRLDRGFVTDGVLAVDVAFPASRYPTAPARVSAYDRLLDAVAALPGVKSASTTSMLPFGGQGTVNFVASAGDTRPRAEWPPANFRFVGPDFFRTLGLPVLRGRPFTAAERDPNRPFPAVVSQRTARTLWPEDDALGRIFSRGDAGEQPFQVVGIVGDAHTTSLEAAPPLMVYVPYWWRSRTSTWLLLKTPVDAVSLLPGIRRVVRAIDPDIAIGESRPLDDLLERALGARRYQMRLFITFGLVALAIAVIGIYATTAYGVSRRRREMNIRLALGAQTTQVVGLIVRQGGAPIVAGMTAGVLGAAAAGGVVAKLLFDVQPRDPLVIAATVALVGAVGFAACIAAAKHGLAIDPAAALREE